MSHLKVCNIRWAHISQQTALALTELTFLRWSREILPCLSALLSPPPHQLTSPMKSPLCPLNAAFCLCLHVKELRALLCITEIEERVRAKERGKEVIHFSAASLSANPHKHFPTYWARCRKLGDQCHITDFARPLLCMQDACDLEELHVSNPELPCKVMRMTTRRAYSTTANKHFFSS